MANPLARVVMRKMVNEKDEAIGQRNRGATQSVNLDSKEENLLLDIMNGNKKATTLESLGAKSRKKPSSSSNSRSKSSPSNSGAGMGSLKTLDALSIGKAKTSSPRNSSKSSYGTKKSNYGNQSSPAKNGGVKGVSLESLVSGNGESKNLDSKPQSRTEQRNQNTKKSSGMMSLNQLAGDKPKSASSSASSKKESSVKGTVIGNLNTYVPKVTLGSIGKKGSL